MKCKLGLTLPAGESRRAKDYRNARGHPRHAFFGISQGGAAIQTQPHYAQVDDRRRLGHQLDAGRHIGRRPPALGRKGPHHRYQIVLVHPLGDQGHGRAGLRRRPGKRTRTPRQAGQAQAGQSGLAGPQGCPPGQQARDEAQTDQASRDKRPAGQPDTPDKVQESIHEDPGPRKRIARSRA